MTTFLSTVNLAIVFGIQKQNALGCNMSWLENQAVRVYDIMTDQNYDDNTLCGMLW